MFYVLWYHLWKLEKYANQYLKLFKDKYKCSKIIRKYRIKMFVLPFFIFFCVSLTLYDEWKDKSAIPEAK